MNAAPPRQVEQNNGKQTTRFALISRRQRSTRVRLFTSRAETVPLVGGGGGKMYIFGAARKSR